MKHIEALEQLAKIIDLNNIKQLNHFFEFAIKTKLEGIKLVKKFKKEFDK